MKARLVPRRRSTSAVSSATATASRSTARSRSTAPPSRWRTPTSTSWTTPSAALDDRPHHPALPRQARRSRRSASTAAPFRRAHLRPHSKSTAWRSPRCCPSRSASGTASSTGNVALRAVHFPEGRDELGRAVRRLKFEEFFFLQLLLALTKGRQEREPASPFDGLGPLGAALPRRGAAVRADRRPEARARHVAADTASGPPDEPARAGRRGLAARPSSAWRRC